MDDLRVPPGNRLEALKDDRKGQHSIRIDDQWRVCFVWDDGNVHEVDIVDYHESRKGRTLNMTHVQKAEGEAPDDHLENAHPGRMLREDFLRPLGITAYQLAKGTGLSQIHVSELLRGTRRITPMTSLLLGKFFGMSARFWLNLQNRYDLIEAQRANPQRLARVVPFAPGTAE